MVVFDITELTFLATDSFDCQWVSEKLCFCTIYLCIYYLLHYIPPAERKPDK